MIYKILTLKNMSTDYLKIYKKKENDKMEEKKKTSSKNSNIKKNSNKKNNNKLDNNKNLKKQNIQTKKTVVKDDNKKEEVKKEKVVLEEVKEEVEVKDEEKDAEKEQQIKEKNQNIKLEKIFCIIVAGIFITNDIATYLITSISIFAGLFFGLLFIVTERYNAKKEQLKDDKNEEARNYLIRYRNFSKF